MLHVQCCCQNHLVTLFDIVLTLWVAYTANSLWQFLYRFIRCVDECFCYDASDRYLTHSTRKRSVSLFFASTHSHTFVLQYLALICPLSAKIALWNSNLPLSFVHELSAVTICLLYYPRSRCLLFHWVCLSVQRGRNRRSERRLRANFALNSPKELMSASHRLLIVIKLVLDTIS